MTKMGQSTSLRRGKNIPVDNTFILWWVRRMSSNYNENLYREHSRYHPEHVIIQESAEVPDRQTITKEEWDEQQRGVVPPWHHSPGKAPVRATKKSELLTDSPKLHNV